MYGENVLDKQAKNWENYILWKEKSDSNSVDWNLAKSSKKNKRKKKKVRHEVI